MTFMRTVLLTLLTLAACGGPEPTVRPDADPDQPEPAEGIQFIQDGSWAVEWEGEAPWTVHDKLSLDDGGTRLTWEGGEELLGEQRDFCRCFPHWLQGERDWCLCPSIESITADIRTGGDVVASLRARLE